MTANLQNVWCMCGQFNLSQETRHCNPILVKNAAVVILVNIIQISMNEFCV